MSEWHGSNIQGFLLTCEIVEEQRFTEVGPGPWYFLKLGPKIIPLGHDRQFADLFLHALRRNAAAFERPTLISEDSDRA